MVRVGVVDADGGDVEQLLTLTGRGVGQVDDVEDLGAAEAGDLHGSHAGEGRQGSVPLGAVPVPPAVVGFLTRAEPPERWAAPSGPDGRRR